MTLELVLDVSEASVEYQQSEPQVAVRTTPRSARDFADFSRKHVREVVDVAVDGVVISSPRLQTPIAGGFLVLGGDYDLGTAENLASRLSAHQARLAVRARPKPSP